MRWISCASSAGRDDRSDWSYVSQPSIGEHAQNSSMRDWTALIELNRDAWRAAAAASPDRALAAAQAWSQLPYPLFRRLAFFAAAQHDVVPPGQGLGWLLADDIGGSGRWRPREKPCGCWSPWGRNSMTTS